MGKWSEGETSLLGPDLLLAAKAHFVGIGPSKVAACFAWKDENTLELVLRYIESPHKETITCTFDKNTVALNFVNSNMPDHLFPVLKGTAK
jgi:hypothetical protein